MCLVTIFNGSKCTDVHDYQKKHRQRKEKFLKRHVLQILVLFLYFNKLEKEK